MISRMMFNVAFKGGKVLRFNAFRMRVWFCAWLRCGSGRGTARDRLHNL
jgi:hypothetical protein